MSKKSKPADEPPAAEKSAAAEDAAQPAAAVMDKKTYRQELAVLQLKLVKLQEWASQKHVRLVVLLEGLGPAGKGRTAQTIADSLQQSACEVVTLKHGGKRDAAEPHFRRFADQMPKGRKLLVLDGSWYHLAAMDRARGLLTGKEFAAHLAKCTEFERELAKAGVTLLKYWFTAGDDVQDARFRGHLEDLLKAGAIHAAGKKASATVPVAEVRQAVLSATGDPFAWRVIDAEDKRRGRLDCLADLLQEAERRLKAAGAAKKAG